MHCPQPIPRAGATAPVVASIQLHGLRRAVVGDGKVAIVVGRSTGGAVVLEGRRCADGTPLRFSYGGRGPGVGTPRLELHGAAGELRTGYMLWSKAGDWELTVTRGTATVASIVFCVAARRDGPAPCR